MKYLKIHLQGDNTRIIYPSNYENEIGQYAVDHLYYEDNIYLKLLLCIPDNSYKSSMIRTNVEEITEIEALSISDNKEIRKEKIVDEAKLRRLELKANLGQKLSADELNAIDITKSKEIFDYEETLTDRIKKLKSKYI